MACQIFFYHGIFFYYFFTPVVPTRTAYQVDTTSINSVALKLIIKPQAKSLKNPENLKDKKSQEFYFLYAKLSAPECARCLDDGNPYEENPLLR